MLSLAQAVAHGLPHETLRRRVVRGIWQRLLPGTYVLQCGPPDILQRSIAALLYAGDDSMITGATALAAHRLALPLAVIRTTPAFAAYPAHALTAATQPADSALPPPTTPASAATHPAAAVLPSAATQPADAAILTAAHPIPMSAAASASFTAPANTPVPRLDVLVPHRIRRQNTAGVRIIRTTHLPTPVESGALRLAPLAKAVIDSCLVVVEDGHPAVAETLVTAALADGRVGLAELEDELGRAPRRYSGALRAHLAGQRAAARSEASSRLLAALHSTGPFGSLPDVVVYEGQRRVAQAVALWPTRAVAAAVDAPEQEVETLSALGFAVLQIPPQRVAQDLPGVLRQVGAVLMERPEATLPVGISLLPRASADRAAQLPERAASRVLTASSPARTGCASVLPRGGTGHT